MEIEKLIQDKINSGFTRLEAIASLNLGERSEAAKRCIIKRAKRLQILNSLSNN